MFVGKYGVPLRASVRHTSVDVTDARNGIVPRYAILSATELFFEELKSTLGFHQYQFQAFEPVEGWAELALTTFMYVEEYRRHQTKTHHPQ